jgi:hypothetical protein
VRGLAEQDVAGTGVLLEPGRDVDRVPGHQPLVGQRLTGDHLAGVDPDPVRDRDTPAGTELLVQAAQRVAHLVCRTDRPERVVLVQPRYPEHRHHRVADELLHGAVVPFDHPAHLVEVQRHHAAYRLRVEPFAHRGRADHVAEDHRDGLAYLARVLCGARHRGAALGAEPRRCRGLLLAPVAAGGLLRARG